MTSVKSLTMLSLLHNPVVTRRNYREYVIHKFPNLRVLDFKKVKDKEREAAKKLFKTKEGKTQLKDISRKAKTFTPGDALPEATNKTTNSAGLTPEQVWNCFPFFHFQRSLIQVRSLKTAIAKASSLDEIERLNQMLHSGTVSVFSILKTKMFIMSILLAAAWDEAKGGGEWGRNGNRVNESIFM